MRPRYSSLLLAAALALVFGLLAGCGSSSDTAASDEPSQPNTSPSSSPPPSSSAPSPSPGQGSGSSSDSATSPSGAQQIVITIKDYKFDVSGPVAPGGTIKVVNKDIADHTVTADRRGSFDVMSVGGTTKTFTAPEEPGKYPFLCTIHPAMTDTLVVG